MIEAGHRNRFLKEPLLDNLIARVLPVELFDRHNAPGCVDVLGLKNRTKAAASDIVRDLIVAYSPAAHILGSALKRIDFEGVH
jgi:hypothetical protein